MKIIILGAGALGSYFGGRMLEAGADVSFFIRERRANELKKSGLQLYSPNGNFSTNDISLYTNIKDIQEADLLLLAVKGYHLDQAIKQAAEIVNKTGAFVLPVLNGVEHIERLQAACGMEKVIGGYASIIATLNEAGNVLHTSGGARIEFGALHPQQEKICNKLEQMNTQVKADMIRTDDIMERMWYKYMFITAFSGVTSATQLPAGYIANTPATLATFQRVFNEIALLAENEVQRRASSINNLAHDATSSMHQDMRKGLQLEVEHLQGGALRIAEKHNVNIPVTETIYGILKPYANGKPK